MPPKTYTKKAEQVEALEYDGTNHQEMLDFCPELLWDEAAGKLFFQRVIQVNAGDYIAKDLIEAFSLQTQFLAFYRPGGGP